MFRTYHAGLCAVAVRYLTSFDAAEDVAQDVFSDVWRKRATWIADQANLRPRLYRAVVNRAISAYRRCCTETKYQREDIRPTCEPSPDEYVRLHQLRAATEAAVSALPEQRRRICVLKLNQD